MTPATSSNPTQPFYLIESLCLPTTLTWRRRYTGNNHFHITSDPKETFTIGPIRGLAEAEPSLRYFFFMIYLQFLYEALSISPYHLVLYLEDPSLRRQLKTFHKSHFPNVTFHPVKGNSTFQDPNISIPLPFPPHLIWNRHKCPNFTFQVEETCHRKSRVGLLELKENKAVLRYWKNQESISTSPPDQTHLMNYSYWDNQTMDFIFFRSMEVKGPTGDPLGPEEKIYLDLGFSLNRLLTTPYLYPERWYGYRFDTIGRHTIEFIYLKTKDSSEK